MGERAYETTKPNLINMYVTNSHRCPLLNVSRIVLNALKTICESANENFAKTQRNRERQMRTRVIKRAAKCEVGSKEKNNTANAPY